MDKQQLIIFADNSNDTSLTLDELCEICDISGAFIRDLIEYEIIQPKEDDELNQWKFDLNELARIKTALRLQRDLEVNLAGAALVLDLMEQIDELHEKMQLLEKHYLR